jgi:excisionase family DNA binding protein
MVKRFLPEGLPPIGLSRKEAASYIGVSENTFSAMVEAGEMPPPRMAGARLIWLRPELDQFSYRLPIRGGSPPRQSALADWD